MYMPFLKAILMNKKHLPGSSTDGMYSEFTKYNSHCLGHPWLHQHGKAKRIHVHHSVKYLTGTTQNMEMTRPSSTQMLKMSIQQ